MAVIFWGINCSGVHAATAADQNLNRLLTPGPVNVAPFQSLARLDPVQQQILRNQLKSQPTYTEDVETFSNEEDDAATAPAAPSPSAAPATQNTSASDAKQPARLTEEERQSIRQDVRNYSVPAKNNSNAVNKNSGKNK